MAFPWPGKKDDPEGAFDIEVAEQTPAAAGNQADPLTDLTEQLGKLGNLLEMANRQVVAYLIHRESETAAPAAEKHAAPAVSDKLDALAAKLDQLAVEGPAAARPAGEPAQPAATEAALKATLAPLQEGLQRIESKLESLAARGGGPDDSTNQALAELRQGITEQKESLCGAFRQLRQRVDDGLGELAEYIRPEEPEADASGPASSGDWQRAIIGRELAEHPALGFQRQQLLNGVLQGEAGACALAGQLLVFQSAPAEKMPQLLKDVGEAYYRWQPKTGAGSNAVEEALIGWLKKACEDAGIGNTIELVHPGQRFDSARHTASARGVEITEVYGWIVLRDNGRVYTKANVAAK